MVANKIQKNLMKLLGDRNGTAEVIGSVMFLVILFFVFTNVYLWHDSANQEMNGVIAEKMNSPISLSNVTNGLKLVNKGGFEVGLSRLWLVNDTDTGDSMDHMFIDLEPFNIRVAAGADFYLGFMGADNMVMFDVELDYGVPTQPVRCKILTTLGNMAACTYIP